LLGQLDIVKTKINMKEISFDIGRFKNMILIAIGDSDGHLSVFSLLSLSLLIRMKVQKEHFDIAIM